MRCWTRCCGLLAVLTLLRPVGADDALLLFDNVPADGLAVAPIDLASAAALCQEGGPVLAAAVRGYDEQGRETPLQFVPDDDFDGQRRAAGIVVAKLPAGGKSQLRLTWNAPRPERRDEDARIVTPSYIVTHDAKQGGFPGKIEFPATGKVFDSLRFNDRVYLRELGGFNLRHDARPQVTRVSRGPLCDVVRVRATYQSTSGVRPASQPEAVYDWCYFHDQPLVWVRARLRQRQPFAWSEAHFLELNFPDEAFAEWLGGEPIEKGRFQNDSKSTRVPRWGALLDGRNVLGMLGGGPVLFYDGMNNYGRYMHARGDTAWGGWSDTRLETSAWLWIGATDKPAATLQAAAQALPTSARVAVTTRQTRARIEAARKSPPARQLFRAAAEQLESQGRLEDAVRAVDGTLPDRWTAVASGDLALLLEATNEGIRLISLYDARSDRQLLAPQALPLFALSLRNTETKDETQLSADAGWKQVRIDRAGGDSRIVCSWLAPADARLGPVAVTLRATLEPASNAISWDATASVEKPWSVWRLVFPQVALAGGAQMRLLFPQCAGVVKPLGPSDGMRWNGTYPSGWATMPFMAVYDQAAGDGLYVGVHDPWGGVKDLSADSREPERGARIAFDHPAPNMGQAGNGFALEGQVVWRLFRGDWYDAAVVYRDWVRRHAEWYPKLGVDGRDDTPRWMRELCVWAIRSGAAEQVVQPVRDFAQALDLPAGLHWYSWHEIPFDNDYPHYFPTKPGFADGVRALQQSNVSVMPYINGRLWDTRDRGLEDFEFTRVALPSATKDESGKPSTETYSSKESDESKVVLAAMCPSTQLWRDRQRSIVLRLMRECGVKGVYMDQIAAAKANLCFDAAHGHPLGGGHWWTKDGYWPLLAAIRREMPPDRMLTTECNAEPYIRWFDGYLTWHWQYDGQVPAFPAVYGGAIQMFGRAYRGGPTKDLALRMKAAEQLVFGEQLGWLDPSVIKEKDNFAFFRQAVRLRWLLRRYFYAGEMARPPRLSGDIPRVRADWQWSGEWPVTTDALRTGAWRLPAENRLVLMFANVSDQSLPVRMHYDLREYGFGPRVRLVRFTADGPGETLSESSSLDRELVVPPRSVGAWEIAP